MNRFVKLTGADGEPRWIRADAIIDIRQYDGGTFETGHRLTCIDCLGGYSPSVYETPEQILALLDAPGTAEVTDDVAKAARVAFWATVNEETTGLGDWRAAIEAADRARGLRP
jgi:hypothetical protein